METQLLKSKLAEIRYRQKISSQHTGQKIYFEAEPNQKEMRQILAGRLRDYKKTFQDLKKKNLLASPFLEIGAEYCLASTLLVNEFQVNGIATDISLYSLKKAEHFAKMFHFPKLPRTICADANNLPFAKNSFRFIFVYESLHHFPNPFPVIKEIERLLAPGGVCLIGSDPIKQAIQLKIWRRPTKLRTWEKFLKLAAILPFISHIGKTEVDYGILEEAFPLNVWQKSLSVFDQVEVDIETPLGLSQSLVKSNSKKWLSPNLPVKLILFFLGGGLQAILKKKGHLPKKIASNLEELLVCPDCLKNGKEMQINQRGKNYTCPNCQNIFPIYKNVPIILEKSFKSKVLSSF